MRWMRAAYGIASRPGAPRSARSTSPERMRCTSRRASETGGGGGETSISAEHAATAVLRATLLDALLECTPAADAPRVVFAAPSGERHDLGLISAALVARCHGADTVFVGADVPEEDLLSSVAEARADVLALGFVTLSEVEIEATLRRLRRALPARVSLWVGGRGVAGGASIPGVDRLESMVRLEAFVLEARRGIALDDAGGQR